MPALLLLGLLALGTPATTGKGQCDAKRFTLSKPAPAKPAAKTAAEPAPPKTAQASPGKPKPAAKPVPKVAIGCKQPASK